MTDLEHDHYAGTKAIPLNAQVEYTDEERHTSYVNMMKWAYGNGVIMRIGKDGDDFFLEVALNNISSHFLLGQEDHVDTFDALVAYLIYCVKTGTENEEMDE
jgi:hypothetical protein